MRLFNAPELINWNYTYLCNLNCKHCYSRANRYPEELDTVAYRQIAHLIAKSGIFTVSFGGGEPLLRSDFFEIHEILKRQGLTTYLTTNGWFLNRDAADELATQGLDRLLVSIDHSNETKNDEIRGKNSFQKAVTGIDCAVRAGVYCAISCVISQKNLDSMQGMIDLARDLGAQEVEFKKFRPSGNGMINEKDFMIYTEDSGILSMYQSLEVQGLKQVLFLGFSAYSEAKFCGCGWRSLCLRPNGDLVHCPYTDTVIGNIMDTVAGGFLETWIDNPVLNDIRGAASCEANIGARTPSNPGLIQARQISVR